MEKNFTPLDLNKIAPLPIKKENTNKILFVIAAFLTILFIFLIFRLNQSKMQEVEEQKSKISPTRIIFPTLVASPTAEVKTATGSVGIADPIKQLIAVLSSNDYIINTKGKIESTESTAISTSSSSLDLNNAVFYLKKGDLVRADANLADKKESYLKTDNEFIYFNNLKKTYSKISINDAMGKLVDTAMRSSLPLIKIIDDDKNKLLSWKKITTDEWQTDWQMQSPLEIKPIPVLLKIKMNPVFNLVDIISIKYKDSSLWQKIDLQYQKATAIDSYLVIPKDYQEEKFGF